MKLTTLLFLLVVIATTLHAQPTNTSFTFNHIALSVKDVDRSASFYQEVLNLQEITNRTQMKGIRWFSIGDGKEMHLISTLGGDITINKAVHIALSTTYFDAFVGKLNALKIPYSDWPGTPSKISVRADGVRQLFFQDVDGYWLEVNSVEQK